MGVESTADESPRQQQRPRRPSLGQRMATLVLGNNSNEASDDTANATTPPPPDSPMKRRPSLSRRPSLGRMVARRPSLSRSSSHKSTTTTSSSSGSSAQHQPPQRSQQRQQRRPSLGKGVSMIMNSLGVGSRHQRGSHDVPCDDETADLNASFTSLEGSTDGLGWDTASTSSSSLQPETTGSATAQQQRSHKKKKKNDNDNGVLRSIEEHVQRLTVCLDRIEDQIQSNVAMARARYTEGGDTFAAQQGAVLSMRKAHKNRLVRYHTSAARDRLIVLLRDGGTTTRGEQKASLRDVFTRLKRQSADIVVPSDDVLLEQLRQMTAAETTTTTTTTTTLA